MDFPSNPPPSQEQTTSGDSPVVTTEPSVPSSGGNNTGPGTETSGSDAKAPGPADSNGGNELGPEFQSRDGQHHPIAEFLYQLTKMLTDDNSEIIEWSDGRIKVHYPERLEGEVLHKYFRHSKFASFQRQLNYFGFRKIAGKGKMSPCSYVNEAATSDIRSLLLIKRKTNGSAARKAAMQQRAAAISGAVNPALLGMNLSALATAGGQQQLGNMNGQALSNAMSLLSENALRAGLGPLQFQQGMNNSISNTQLSLLALQQQQQQLQQQLQQQQQQQFQQLARGPASQEQMFLPQQQQQQGPQPDAQGSRSDAGFRASDAGNKHGSQKSPSLEQLHAHLSASLAASQQQQQQQQQNTLNMMGGAPGLAPNPATAALRGLAPASADQNPATAALQAQNGGGSMPATAAMDAASATAQTSNSLFESAINLKSLLQEHQESVANAAAAANNAQLNGQALRNRLPSSGAIFPENLSTVSLSNLLGSSNRLNSLLSLNSFSREASLADFAAANGMTAQFAAAGNPQFNPDARFRSN